MTHFGNRALSFCLFALSPLLAASVQSDCRSCEPFGLQRYPNNKEAPPFTLRSMGGTQVALDQLKGKPVLLFFWGTWCEACKEDIVLLEKFAEGKKDQLSIYTVLVDGERERRGRDIVSKLKITLPVLLVTKEKVLDNYEIRMIPSAYFIDRDGFLVGRILGQRDWCTPAAWSATKELLSLP